MNVIKNKISKSIKGKGGKGDADINYSLLAPNPGKFLSSKEFLRSLDLICEGPIEGIVDQEGSVVEGKSVLKGIYLDDVPIMTSEGKFNFKNMRVDGYHYGLEEPSVIPNHQSPIVQKEINFNLIGPFITNQTFEGANAVFSTVFSDFVESESVTPSAEDFENPSGIFDFKETVYRQRISSVSIVSGGAGYNEDSPPTLRYSPIDARLSGGGGVVYEQPDFDITFNQNGEVTNISISNSGVFSSYRTLSGYSGEGFEILRSGFFEIKLTEPFDEPSEIGESVTATGTGYVNYSKFLSGEEILQLNVTGTFTGFIFKNKVENENQFFSSFLEDPEFEFIGNILNHEDITGSIYEVIKESSSNSSFFSFTTFDEKSIFEEIVSASPTSAGSASMGGFDSDIRNGYDYAAWNTAKAADFDDFSYTHVLTNPYVNAVAVVVNVVKLNDTEHKARQSVNITKKPGLFGGTARADAAFSIGNPINATLNIELEWGLFNTPIVVSKKYSIMGTTVGGYLLEFPTLAGLNNNLYSALQSLEEYKDLTIDQLKREYPRYVKISKKDFETDSVLINRVVQLAYIKEKTNLNFSYPSSAVIGTTIDSSNFNTPPKRSYDVKLKKVFAPFNYNPLDGKGLDKRFQEEIVPYDGIEILKRITIKSPYEIRPTNDFGETIASSENFLAISDYSLFDRGQIYIYDKQGFGESVKLQIGTLGGSLFMALDVQQGGLVWDPNEYPGSVGNYDYIKYGLQNGLSTPQWFQMEFQNRVVGKIWYSRAPVVSHYHFGNNEFLYLNPGGSGTLKYRIDNLATDAFGVDILVGSGEDYFNKGYVTHFDFWSKISGVVIGGCYDPSARAPDIIFKKIYCSKFGPIDKVEVGNPSKNQKLYIKFFPAQLMLWGVNRKRLGDLGAITDFQVVPSEFLSPIYDRCVMPVNMRILNAELIDDEFKDIMFIGRDILLITDQYLIFKAILEEDNTRNVLQIAKINEFGVWKNFKQFLFEDDQDDTYDILDAKISKTGNFLIVLPKISVNKRRTIYTIDLNNEVNIKHSFTEYGGLFEDDIFGMVNIRHSSNPGDYSVEICMPDDLTIIVHNTRVSMDYLDNIRKADNEDSNLIMIYRFKNESWDLDQVISPPDYENKGNSDSSVDAEGNWLAVGYRTGFNETLWDSNGWVALFKFNGKKYEFVKKFAPDIALNEEIPLSSPENTEGYFGSRVKISINECGDPILYISDPLAPASNGTRGVVYIVEKNPQKDEFSSIRIESENALDINKTNQRFGIAGTENTLAFSKLNGSAFSNVEVVKLKTETNTATRIYENDIYWNGVLQKKWTDNPAWIIYDLLTNIVYGAGSLVDSQEDINIYNFYDLGRYFDSVDDQGYIKELYDEEGRIEPRLSCNFLLDEDYNAFEVISAITDLFFGGLYIENGKYSLWADRPTQPSWFFSNNDVVDGNFTYAEKYKQDKISVVKVPFLDKYDNFVKKIEYIEDEKLLRENGKIEKELTFTAFTSRSQARRYGKHFMYNNSYETEMVNFQTDDRALLLSPGDVIEISDELKNFSTKRELWPIEKIESEEKIHLVTYNPDLTPYQDNLRYYEGIVYGGDVSNAEWSYVDYDWADIFGFGAYSPSLKVDDLGAVYISAWSYKKLMILKKNQNSFVTIELQEEFSTSSEESNIIIDQNNAPILPFADVSGNYTRVGFYKLSNGGDFENSGDWTKNILQPLLGESLNDRVIIGKADSQNNLYLLTRVQNESENKLILYKTNVDNFTSESYEKYEFAATGYKSSSYFRSFDLELRNDKPAIAYKLNKMVRYTELTGSNFNESASWSDVYIQGGDNPSQSEIIDLNFNRENKPFISHVNGSRENVRMYTIGDSGDVSDYKSWEKNQTLFLKPAANRAAAPFLFLNDDSLVMLRNQDYRIEGEIAISKRSLVTYHLDGLSKINQPEKLKKNIIYQSDQFASSNSNYFNVPAIDYSFSNLKIQIKNNERFLYDEGFNIDTQKSGNLIISKIEFDEAEDLFYNLQFENFQKNRQKTQEDDQRYLNVTGFEFSGDFINLHVEKTKDIAKTLNTKKIENFMASVVVEEDVQKKAYRVLNVKEIEKNIYQIEGKEFHSGKFEFIENYENLKKSDGSLYNIGIPSNKINVPPPPIGVSFETGLDNVGSAYVTGVITGEPNGLEIKYKVGITYPNAKYIEKEFEKNANNLSVNNEPLTNFGFYNLPIVGEYNLRFKSIRNPESSFFIDRDFTIDEYREQISDNPYFDGFYIETDGEQVKLKTDIRNVFGEKMDLYTDNYYLKIRLEEEYFLTNQKTKEFEMSLDAIKEFKKNSERNTKFTAELCENDEIIDSINRTLFDSPTKIKNADIFSNLDLFIQAEVEEFQKIRFIKVYANEELIKTFLPQNQNKIQKIDLIEHEIQNLPKDEKIEFKLIAADVFGEGKPFCFEGLIPRNVTAMQKYQKSIMPIYSAHYWDHFSGEVKNFESSNSGNGFYGNGASGLFEISCSMISGESGSLKVAMESENDKKEIDLNFKNPGYLSKKVIFETYNDFYGVNILSEGGLFEGLEFKIKKI